MTPFELINGRQPTTVLDAMLPHVENDDLNADVQGYLQRAEEAGQLARSLGYVDSDGWEPSLPVRLFMTHRTHIRETMNKDAKYIYLARNPWDICISLFCMTTDLSCFQLEDGTLQEFFEPFIEGDLGYGSYFDHVASAYAIKDEPNFFFVTYEELKKDMKGAVLRLASFLGETYERALLQNSQMLQNILEWSEPEHMRKVILVNFSGNTVTSKEGYGGDRAK
ncbi:sulfotransferase 2A1 [Dermacentor silvarum]|uniref:sulfotransferase 2A1 n=1 Tax=Dermacentor silvarum TaxID=543639 RepID=UPI0018979CC3|nr:sulfotransferase 2A1 [Dermacentor silvarum]